MTTRIVAAILDTAQLVLYKEDGSKIVIPQGDVRVQRIIDEATTPLSTQGWADVEIGYAADQTNDYKEFEETSSVVKFFRVAKRFVKHLFNPETDAPVVEPVTLGSVPVEGNPLAPAKVVDTKAASVPEKVRDATTNVKPEMSAATAQIMANAKSVSAPDYNSADTNSEDETIIAVTTGTDGKQAIIPGVEQLATQVKHSTKMGNPKGMENFLARLGPVIASKGHSVQELLNFMSKGDLPIADDGCIIGYKVLRSTPKKDSYSSGERAVLIKDVPLNYYVDCHSGNVLQRIGSLVQQEKVDANRRTECSTGLHIARRQYLSGFGGDIICLVKIRPEDIVAVPHGEPNKMRAAAYHIINALPKEEHNNLRNNKPLQGDEAKRMLAMAISGDHVDIVEDVVIQAGYGSKITVTQRLDSKVTSAPAIPDNAPVAETVADIVEEEKIVAPKVDAKAVEKAVTETKQAPKPVEAARIDDDGEVPELTQEFFDKAEIRQGDEVIRPAAPREPVAPAPAEVVTVQRQMFNERRYADLIVLKRAKKKSWALLGFNQAEVDTIEGATPKTVTTVDERADAKVKQLEKAVGKPIKSAASFDVLPELASDATRNQKAAHYLTIINGNYGDGIKRTAYVDLLALKKKSKVSWSQLNVSNFDAIQAMFEK